MTSPVTVIPMDHANQELIANLHPSDWQNPQFTDCYNLVIIGGGTAGLVTAAGAGLFGAKVALIEKHLLGGDCTNTGCVPSKAIIRSGRIAAAIASAYRYGIQVPPGIEIDFSAVMERMRRLRAEISHHDSAKRFQQEFGVDIFFGAACFLGHHTLDVNGQTLKFKKAVIATGSSPVEPSIPGLAEVGYLTNETIFSLTQCPQQLTVIGGGYIGCELAQTFQRLGSQVTLLQQGEQILPKSDLEASKLLQNVLEREGVNLVLNAQVQEVTAQAQKKVIRYTALGIDQEITADEILVAVGRQPNVKGLNLDHVGVKFDAKQGILVNDFLQTDNPNIYAVGDVCMNWKFTHAADAAARIVVQNTLFSIGGIGRKKLSSLVMPSCIYTDPEIAHVGITEAEIQQTKPQQDKTQQTETIQTFYVPLNQVDRAILDEDTEGFIKVHVKRGSDKILGATIVAPHAGELISQITLAMVSNVGLGTLAKTVYPYPTQAELIRKAADQYNLSWITGWVKTLTSNWFKWQR
ncbi:MAG: mercuric reductase [Microcoleaceae cyanobacterium]